MELSLNNETVCTGTLPADVLKRYLATLSAETEISLADERDTVSMGRNGHGHFTVIDWGRGIIHDASQQSLAVDALVRYFCNTP